MRELTAQKQEKRHPTGMTGTDALYAIPRFIKKLPLVDEPDSAPREGRGASSGWAGDGLAAGRSRPEACYTPKSYAKSPA